ncbi:MAG: hypothetical protein WBM90_07455 [Acidimicrobiia bacterium]
MVLPDGTGLEPERPNTGRKTLLVVGGTALVIAVVAVGSVTGGSPSSSEPPATTSTINLATPRVTIDLDTWRVSDIATDDAPSWELAATLDGIWPISLLEHRGTVYLFGASGVPAIPGGLAVTQTWQTEDGTTWTERGDVFPPGTRIQSVTSSGTELVAVGSTIDHPFVVLVSENGLTWTDISPPNADLNPGDQFHSVVANQEQILVMSLPDISNGDALTTALEQDYSGPYLSWGIESYGPETGSIIVRGPLGIPVVRLDPSDLGLDAEDLNYTGDGPEAPPTLWSRVDGEWSALTPSQSLYMLTQTPSGELAAVGSDDTQGGTSIWTVGKDIATTPQHMAGYIYSDTVNWGGRMVTPNDQLGNDLRASSDLETWEPLGLAELLPYQLGWGFSHVAAGVSGLATVAMGYHDARPSAQLEVASIEDGEATLTFDPQRGTLDLRLGDEEIASLTTWGDIVPENVIPDLESETLVFLHPETSDQLATFSFAELAELENRAFRVAEDRQNRFQTFLFTEDGDKWLVQDLNDVLGNDGWPVSLLVSRGQVTILSVDDVSLFYRAANTPDLDIWVGELP